MVWPRNRTNLNIRGARELASQVVDSENAVVLNLSGLRCPQPALRTKKYIERVMSTGDTVLVISTDELSMIDIPHLVRTLGYTLLSKVAGTNEFRFLIEKS